PTVIKLQMIVADLLGKEDALFVASGTMANQVCLRTLTRHGDEIILEEDSHIFNYEVGSASALSGLQLYPIRGSRGVITAEQIKERIRPDDIHIPPTRVIVLENTHNRAGGTVFPLDEMKNIFSLASEFHIKMHLDGARLWNAVMATGTPLHTWAKPFDSVSVCLSKGLGAPIGSVIAGSGEFVRKARRVRKMYGGGMRQVGIIAAAGIYAIENNFNRLVEDHRNAQLLAERLKDLEGLKIDLESVQTNIVVIDIAETKKSVEQFLKALKEKGILLVPFGKNRIRAVTHLDVKRDQILEAVEKFKEILQE
ncbi:MAG: GntG family PLP-dependent aldolase, partial [Candidatus Zixiibacteriota bacterium]